MLFHRYRFFDIFSTSGDDTDPPIQAEYCSAPFRIYSTKVCPRLGPSTELSKVSEPIVKYQYGNGEPLTASRALRCALECTRY